MKQRSKSLELTHWRVLGSIATIQSPWVTVKCERWQDNKDKELDYWRISRPDSVIVIPIHEGSFLLPHPIFRPGVEGCTWDFPGGRVRAGFPREERAVQLLNKELSIRQEDIDSITPINRQGYIVDSSFSSQRVWGYLAKLAKSTKLNEDPIGWRVPITKEGTGKLLAKMDCLQCRALLLEFLRPIH